MSNLLVVDGGEQLTNEKYETTSKIISVFSRINQINSMFPVRAGTETITDGVWMWDQPVRLRDGTSALVLDTEGTCRGVEEVTRVITAFATFLCSLLVYYADHHLSNTDLQYLAVMAEMAKHCSSDTFPGLFLLLRDLDVADDEELKEGYPLRKYLSSTLSYAPSDGEHVNAARASVSQHFKSISAFPLPPTSLPDRTALTDLPTFFNHRHETEYGAACYAVIGHISQAATIKQKAGRSIGGEELDDDARATRLSLRWQFLRCVCSREGS